MNDETVNKIIATLNGAGQFAMEHGTRSVAAEATITIAGGLAFAAVVAVAASALALVGRKEGKKPYGDGVPYYVGACVVACAALLGLVFAASGIAPAMEPADYLLRTLGH